MDTIQLTVNGQQYTVEGAEVSSDTMLVDYLRQHLELRGTKFMCREGGCGACIVTAVKSPGDQPVAVNSCLVSVIQKTLAENNGTQCGHCTPGWIMAMYSLARSKKNLTELEIEKSFASNVCRCTGYRPILASFKKFAADAKNNQIADIEDLYVCKKSNEVCNKSCDEYEWCFVNDNLNQDEVIKINLKDGKKWYRVTQVSQIFDILRAEGDESYMLVVGNTAKGAYPIDEYPEILIDISGVSELKGHIFDQNLVIGAITTLTELLDILESAAEERSDEFGYLKKLHDHIQLVATIPVRNVGSIAGNLMTKHEHPMFPSDIFLLLETVGAYVTIVDANGSKEVPMMEFLKADMKGKILYNVMIPPLNNQYKIETFKIMPRSQNAHAIVNGGFRYKLSNDNKVQEARIVYGNLSPEFIRATKTEEYLKGKALFSDDVLQSALKVLNEEIVVIEHPPDDSAAYRKQLALALFYKGLLTLCPSDKVDARYRSGVKRLHDSRPVSSAQQSIPTDPDLYPLNEPIPKVEALIQCAGEAKYTDDLPAFPNEVFSALVLSTIPKGEIESIDASEALKLPGVIAFYSAKDIPGKNSFILIATIAFIKDEVIFCDDKVSYYNQPLGIIVAESTALAERAAKKVKVTYRNVETPVIDVMVARKDESRTKLFLPIPNIGRGLFVKKEFKSNYTIRAQIHFPMESIVCVTRPSEMGLEVHCTTQWMDAVQYTIAKALNLDINRVDVFTNRVGGGFGLKISRSSLAGVACSLVAYKLNRPCRLFLSLPTVAKGIGKRLPCSCDVEVKVNSQGRVQYMDYDVYEDNGYINSLLLSVIGVDAHHNCYKRLWWNFKIYDSFTDTARNEYCRAPGTLENIAMAETIMEQISYELSLDPYEVRMTNLDSLLYGDIKEMGDDLKTKADYTKRRDAVTKFNAENRWKKRGLRWALMKYTPLSPAGYEVNMSINHGDGSVTINHGGIEVGQGINTKAIQIAAYFLKIPIDKIKVKGQNTVTTPNGIFTGGSLTSQSIGQGVEDCCKQLLLRLEPIRLLLLNPSWEKLIDKAYTLNIDLMARSFIAHVIAPISLVYGVTLAEVEVDILTGESEVLRVDLYEDVGQSVSPNIDVGQVEGAFIMGMGYWTSEKVVYDDKTGEVLSNRAWNYHVPLARDIPQDFRVYFREKSYSSAKILGAKVTGEPATCMAICIPFAMREAISEARKDAGISTTEWFTIDGPYTTEQLCMSAATKLEHFRFKSK
ncbi:indole-3-acetaldehyde oxidase-like isoform X2 [Ostrinia furnacalis]|nr:indole-3-acetaldehyde oxidase-like isoform X2 [Ostrinia furnacalis]